MHTVKYEDGYYNINGEGFCRNLFELFTPSNMHILTETGEYTGDIKIVAGRSMYVHHEPDGVYICCVKMDAEGYPINLKEYKYIDSCGRDRMYGSSATNIFIPRRVLDFPKLNRVRFVLENKNAYSNL